MFGLPRALHEVVYDCILGDAPSVENDNRRHYAEDKKHNGRGGLHRGPTAKPSAQQQCNPKCGKDAKNSAAAEPTRHGYACLNRWEMPVPVGFLLVGMADATQQLFLKMSRH
jgi:hypothetical protein